ncbi:TPA: single fertilization [Trebouxia sp. C0005]
MADPVNDEAHLSPTDNEANGFFESAEDPTAKADSLKPEVMDASIVDSAALANPTDSSTASQEPHQGSAQNGHAESLQHNGHGASADLEESSADSATGSPQEPEEEPWKKRLYFVRVPKFPEDNQYAVKVLQEEIDVYRSQVQLLNESVNIVRMQRDSAKESVVDARESMNAATNAFQAKHREVEPLQTGKKNQNDLQRNVQAEYRDLEVRSEQELDAKIRDMENHMAHESIPIAQERQMVKHIKKLRDSRQRVRQYEHMYAGIENARAAVRSGQGELKELLQERQVLVSHLILVLAADYHSMIARIQ